MQKTAKKAPFLSLREPSELEKIIFKLVKGFGGFVNYHGHFDRAFTTAKRYMEHCGVNPLHAVSLPLSIKQILTGELHKGPAYEPKDLSTRIERCLKLAMRTGTREAVSFIDTTPDIGLRAIEIASELRAKYRGKIDFKIAAHPIFGFKEDMSHKISRWSLFKEACKISDIVGALAEKDNRPDSIGFVGHTRRVIELGLKENKDVHMHLGQANDPGQDDVLDAIEAVRWIIGEPKSENEHPKVWFIHVISPSAYSEYKFRKILEGLKRYNIGVICCPKAAVTMLQLRSLESPTHACIARVLEMAFFGLKIRLGTDNISDMFISTSSGSMIDEVITLSDNIRFANPLVLAKLAAGIDLNLSDKEIIRRHLEEYRKALARANHGFEFCITLE